MTGASRSHRGLGSLARHSGQSRNPAFEHWARNHPTKCKELDSGFRRNDGKYPRPTAQNSIHFSIEGQAEIVATDNGDATDFASFASRERDAFSGLCLVIVRGLRGRTGAATLRAEAEGLKAASVALRSSEAVHSLPREK